ncbi:MAG: GumC family protein [Fimbriimonas sp.]
MPDHSSDEINLGALFAPLRGRQRTLWLGGLIGAVVMLGITIVSKPVWRIQGTILTVIPSVDEASAGGAGGGGLAAMLSPNAPDPLQVLEGVIMSRRSIDIVMKRTGSSRRDVENGLKVTRNPKAAQISVSWEDDDRKRGIAAVQGAFDALSLLNRELGFSAAAQQAKLLESSVAQREKDLAVAESALAQFQKQMKAPSIPGDPASAGEYLKQQKELELKLNGLNASIRQARSVAQESARNVELPSMLATSQGFREKLIGLQFELGVARTEYGPAAPQVVRLERQIEVAREALQKEVTRRVQSVAANVDPAIAQLEADRIVTDFQLQAVRKLASRAPDEAIELARLSREVATLGTLLGQLREQYERTRVAAEVDRVRWNVLEKPFVEDKPTNKRYGRSPAMGFLGGYFLTGAYLLFRGRRKSARNPSGLV